MTYTGRRCSVVKLHHPTKPANPAMVENVTIFCPQRSWTATLTGAHCLGTGVDRPIAHTLMMTQIYISWLVPNLTPRKVRLALLTLATFAALC